MVNVNKSEHLGRIGEDIAKLALEPYAIMIPVEGSQDRFGADFLCVPSNVRDDGRSYAIRSDRMFLLQVKYSGEELPKIRFDNRQKAKDVIDATVPFYVARITNEDLQRYHLELFATSERYPYRIVYGHRETEKLDLHFAENTQSPYAYDATERKGTVYTGAGFLKFSQSDLGRFEDANHKTLMERIDFDRANQHLANAGVGRYERRGERVYYFPTGSFVGTSADRIVDTLAIIHSWSRRKQHSEGHNHSVVERILKELASAIGLEERWDEDRNQPRR